MEDVIQNAEKLVYATNTALTQMKYNMSFEDIPEKPKANSHIYLEKIRHNRRKKKDQILPIQEELEKFENEMRTDTNNLLSSIDDLLDPEHYRSARESNQQSKIIEKIQEINQKIESKKEQLTGKDLDIKKQRPGQRIQFDNEDFKLLIKEVPGKVVSSTPTIAESDKSSRTSLSKTLTTVGRKNAKVAEDLKKNILQTEEVVNRGFETVRQLNQKLDTLKKQEKKIDKAPSFDKISFSSKSQGHFSPKSVSTETVKSCDYRQVREKKKKVKNEKKVENISVFDVKWTECRRHHQGKKLKLQRLPSLHIQNDLKFQKIPSIDILPQEKEELYSKNNVAVKNLIYKEDEEKNLEKFRNKIYEQTRKGNIVECTHCGKYIRVHESNIPPGDIDELLIKCNFNVFDPRIDEFVKKVYEDHYPCLTDRSVEMNSQLDKVDEEEKMSNKRKNKKENEIEKSKEKLEEKDLRLEENENKTFNQVKISQIGEELSRKYKEKTRQIESDYLEFENVIHDIFKKVDESREIFKGTKYFSVKEASSTNKNLKQLSVMKPVVLELKGLQTDSKLIAHMQKEAEETHKTKIENNLLQKNEELNNQKKREENKMFLNEEKKTEIEKKLRKIEESNNKNKNRENGMVVNQIKTNTVLISPKHTPNSEESNTSKNSSISSQFLTEEKKNIDFLEFLKTSNKIESEKTFLPTSPKFIPSDLWKPPILNRTSDLAAIDPCSNEEQKSETSSSSDRAKLEGNSKSSSKKNDVQTDEDYQSDFEVESLESSVELPFENGINIPAIDLSSLETNKVTSNINKLPTISEKDSEAEKKISSSTVSEIISEKIDDVESKEIDKKLQQGKEVSSKRAKEENETKFEPQAELNFYRKVDENLKEVLDEAFEKGASYMLKRQRDILDLNYKATKRKSISKINKKLKKPVVKLSGSFALGEQGKSEENIATNIQRSVSRIQQAADSSKSEVTQAEFNKKENLSNEMFISLKELLDALKTQFTKTELLTEKLTENVQFKTDEKKENFGGVVNTVNPLENLKYVNNIIFNNLQKNRKDFTMNGNRSKPQNIFTQQKEEEQSNFKFLNLSPKNLDNIRLELPIFDRRKKEKTSPSNRSHSSKDDRSLSSGEVVENFFVLRENNIKSKRRKGKQSSRLKDSESDSNSEKVCKSPCKKINKTFDVIPKSSGKESHVSDSISEGEVPSAGLIDDKYDSSQSIGEVVSEQILTESVDDGFS